MERFGASTMEEHQIPLNSDGMKHSTFMNKAYVREIMLQHEKTFKEQVDLHFSQCLFDGITYLILVACTVCICMLCTRFFFYSTFVCVVDVLLVRSYAFSALSS